MTDVDFAPTRLTAPTKARDAERMKAPQIALAIGLVFGLAHGPAFAACGDGVVDPGEQCDFGPDVAGDCCDAACGAAPDATACGSAGACEAGVCVTPLALDFVRIRPQSSDGSNGSVTVRGTFQTSPPVDTLQAPAGVGITVRDALVLEQSVEWAPADCTTTTRGSILCLRPDISRKIRFDPRRTVPAAWRVTVRMKRVSINGPFAGPVTARITTHGAFDRAGQVDCVTAVSGALNCRPPR